MTTTRKDSLDLPCIDMPSTSDDLWRSQVVAQRASRDRDTSAVWLRALRWSAETAKRAYPMLLVFAIFSGLFIVTVAIRIAIWAAAFRN